MGVGLVININKRGFLDFIHLLYCPLSSGVEVLQAGSRSAKATAFSNEVYEASLFHLSEPTKCIIKGGRVLFCRKNEASFRLCNYLATVYSTVLLTIMT